MRFIGIDIGGMSLKGGLVKVAKNGGVEVAALDGIGIGSPGSIDDAAGTIRYSCNINFVKTPIVDMLCKRLGRQDIFVSNDANCAALGETLFGAGKGAKNSVTVTLGTGVGTGIVVDGRLLTGNRRAPRAATQSSRRAARCAVAANAVASRLMPPQARSWHRLQRRCKDILRACLPPWRRRTA